MRKQNPRKKRQSDSTFDIAMMAQLLFGRMLSVTRTRLSHRLFYRRKCQFGTATMSTEGQIPDEVLRNHEYLKHAQMPLSASAKNPLVIAGFIMAGSVWYWATSYSFHGSHGVHNLESHSKNDAMSLEKKTANSVPSNKGDENDVKNAAADLLSHAKEAAQHKISDVSDRGSKAIDIVKSEAAQLSSRAKETVQHEISDVPELKLKSEAEKLLHVCTGMITKATDTELAQLEKARDALENFLKSENHNNSPHEQNTSFTAQSQR